MNFLNAVLESGSLQQLQNKTVNGETIKDIMLFPGFVSFNEKPVIGRIQDRINKKIQTMETDYKISDIKKQLSEDHQKISKEIAEICQDALEKYTVADLEGFTLSEESLNNKDDQDHDDKNNDSAGLSAPEAVASETVKCDLVGKDSVSIEPVT